MAYSLDICELLTKQLTKFASLNRHQLVGHLVNLDFWTDEVRHALAALDGYRSRFKKMKAAQGKYVSENRVINFDLEEPYINWAPSPPRAVADQGLKQARQCLVDAWRKFIVRCHKEQLLEIEGAHSACTTLGISFELEDLQTRS
jgi:hypothetical protein